MEKGRGKWWDVCAQWLCDGDERPVNAIVVIAIMSLSGEEETLRKDNKGLGMVKLRG